MKNLFTLLLGVLVGVSILVGACNFGGGGGDSGDSGQPTAKWFVEKGPPSNSQGANGDLYLDTDNAVLYVKTSGQWVAAASLRGPSGSGWLFGAGVPASTLGSDGDLYLDTSTSMTYRKQGGAWSALLPLKGETGAPGTQWYSGTAVPTLTVPSTARPGDYYLQTSTAMVYKKDAGGNWSSVLVMAYNTASFIFTPHMSSWDENVFFNAVAFGNGIYVAVGNWSTVVRSTDGTNWQLVEYNKSLARILKGLEPDPQPNQTIQENDNLLDIAFGNGKFVVISQNYIYVSSDMGLTWFSQTPAEDSFSHIVFLNGKFFISTNSGHIYSSSDGMTWDAFNTDGTSLSTIAYGNGKYISISSYNGVCTSTNGETWAFTGIESMTGIDSECTISGVVFGNGLFVAIGSNSYGYGSVWLSSDGINWTSQDLALSQNTALFDIAYGNGFAVVGFDSLFSYQNVILTSSNGISWNIQSLPYSSDFSSIYPCIPAGTFVISKGQQRGW